MRNSRLLIFCWSIVLSTVQPSFAQSPYCPNGKCPEPSPSAASPAQRDISATPDTRAVARVINVLGSSRALGSGTLVAAADGRGLVVTCAHLFRDGTGELSVRVSERSRFEAQLLKADASADLAALEIRDPEIPPITVSDTAVRPGEPLVSCGFGSDGRLWCNRGQALGYVTTVGAQPTETLELSGSARFGDSGGPVLDRRGQLVAVLFGTDGHVVDGTYCGRVRKFLAELTPRFCRPGANVPRPSVEPAPGMTPIAPPPSAGAPEVASLAAAQIAELRRIVANLQQSWHSISAKLDVVVAALQNKQPPRGEPNSAPRLPHVEMPPGTEPIGEQAGALAEAAGPWLVARLTALLVSFGVPGGVAGMAAGGVVYLVMRRGRARLQAQLERLNRAGSADSSSVRAPADESDRAIVERHHNRYVPYEVSELDRAWASAHAHVGEKYPGAIP